MLNSISSVLVAETISHLFAAFTCETLFLHALKHNPHAGISRIRACNMYFMYVLKNT